MKIKLLVKHKSSRIVDLAKSYCVMGRADDADVSVSDSQCSKQHAVLYEAFGGELRINDLDSTNGTMVNGKKIAEATLHIGDRVEIGRTVILILDFKCVTDSDADSNEQSGSVIVEKTMIAELAPKAPAANSEVINGGPDKIFLALPSKLQKRFLDYVDHNGTKTRTSVDELLKTPPPMKKAK